MGSVGKIRIGHKAPYFECEAIVNGSVHDVSLSTYIHASVKPSTPDPDAPWLIIMFIPAAFSFVCPTEVLAFQNCLDDFRDRNCNVVFVSVDTKHVLWHWQNVPRQFGGLGHVDIPLLSDANHRIAEDYGVLIEEEGISLRGMFIIDNEGLVQQITVNNITVGRSVLEALRLLEAFQAVAKHGVLCPIDWKPTVSDQANVEDTISAIHNTLTESYEERLANLQKEFGTAQVNDLDAIDEDEDEWAHHVSAEKAVSEDVHTAIKTPTSTPRPSRTQSSSSSTAAPQIQEVVCHRPNLSGSKTNTKTQRECALQLPHAKAQATVSETPPSPPPHATRTSSTSSAATPPMTASTHRVAGVVASQPAPLAPSARSQPSSTSTTSRQTRGPSSAPTTPLPREHSAPGMPPLLPPFPAAQKHQTYESLHGSSVVAEHVAQPKVSRGHSSPGVPFASPPSGLENADKRPEYYGSYGRRSHSVVPRVPSPIPLFRSLSQPPPSSRSGVIKFGSDPSTGVATPASGPTRFQATFQAIKNISAGFAASRFGWERSSSGESTNGSESPYFDVVEEAAEM
ncbi:hypothetical protein ACN47E_001618 [Coniothyrium glycines]